jgi:hypothetical protein
MTGIRPLQGARKLGFAEGQLLGEYDRIVATIAELQAAGASYIRDDFWSRAAPLAGSGQPW